MTPDGDNLSCPADALTWLRGLPSACVQTWITSPPYWGLRDYKTAPLVIGGDEGHAHDWEDASWRPTRWGSHDDDKPGEKQRTNNGSLGHRGVTREQSVCSCGAWRGQLGLEPTPELYVAHQVLIFREARRVLRDDGTLWLNIGDSYANDTKWGGSTGGKHAKQLHGDPVGRGRRLTGLKAKDLVGIPWRLAFALQAAGWYLRAENIWSKPNSMPESVRDRPSRSHEQVFLLTKNARYFYDNVAAAEPSVTQRGNASERAENNQNGRSNFGTNVPTTAAATRNARSVWRVAIESYKGAHFAVMPSELVRRCLVAGTSERGCCASCGKPWARVTEKRRVPTRPGNGSKVMQSDGDFIANQHGQRLDREGPYQNHNGIIFGNRDPKRHCTEVVTIGWRAACACEAGEPVPCIAGDMYMGSGTVAQVATHLGRRFIGAELNAAYRPLIEARVKEKPRCLRPKKERPVVAPSETPEMLFAEDNP